MNNLSSNIFESRPVKEITLYVNVCSSERHVKIGFNSYLI
nr:MAG TPA: PIH1 DOMAIN-CONTAINING PROTEIN 1, PHOSPHORYLATION [Crassvirales sp.]